MTTKTPTNIRLSGSAYNNRIAVCCDYGAMFDQACRLFNTKFLNAEATR